MIALTAAELAGAVAGRLHGDGERSFRGVSRDSRASWPEALFVALRGERFDGHDFVRPELEAAVLLVERPLDDPRPQVVVDDTTGALARLGVYWRTRCTARVVALTGSNGKTTTKEMLRSILSGVGSVHATEGNLNNHIGVPLTLLAMPRSVDYAVIEMGANHAGEIAFLTRLARPEVALITNAGRAHLDGFGSLEGVARAKAEIYAGLPAQGGTAVINLDDRFAGDWLALNRDRPRLGFSLQGRGEIQGVWKPPAGLVLKVSGAERELLLAAPGRHVAQNALAAAAAAAALGCEIDAIARGLQAWRPVAGRLRAFRHLSGAVIWDDTYNANPDSLAAALEVLAGHPGTRVLVLGDMNELGSEARSLHAEMGRRARELGIHRLLASGGLTPAAVEAFGSGARWFASNVELATALVELLGTDAAVLIKGSRDQHMEDILTGLDLRPAGATGEVADAAGAR
ncbi:UDP-N-acetylmuramoylalanyl-D-glutamyl-2,6- diaminopimelate--D-alanyl-D-alanine ligase [Thioalkalivibrio nitratireducens DSM 14787]|uniref:UDP-N-acetylmuramoyl-tripeptide--D-alanyl-D-alanine ligase n=1 Tax=Thioalkalivibrio nitratireducens (strain DSM 14787 / UNIQEM 213 / ALEN2) TaxID=1255043 RepID=L0DXC5_THIND|nr:UDP-N-acetylmuramoyl-tripeptide--D-alanyl-D-alanine ligase [Thioalkalivibrio nitratireducens]AGA34249.1 UDP-N-acetylmuramoylalanyl-D-glutamyl-2,6- diaminopimelate--D-alanyl-D-alanine ligase [Thioalkalivibrio nitratireducens DSM 14787]